MNRKQFLLVTAGAVVLPVPLWATRRDYSLSYQWSHLTEHQKSVRDRAYAAGLLRKFEYSLTAIAWEESSFGLPNKMENPKDPSGGVFGNSYITVARRHFKLGSTVAVNGGVRYITPTNAQLEAIGERLRTDFPFSARHALQTLREGQRHVSNTLIKASVSNSGRLRGRDWLRIWAYYNGGREASEIQDAQDYAQRIKEKVKFMKSVNYQNRAA